MKATVSAKRLGVMIGLGMAVVILTPVLLAVLAYIGYFCGIILMWLAGGVLADGLSLSEGGIPALLAWLFVIGYILAVGGASAKNESKKKK